MTRFRACGFLRARGPFLWRCCPAAKSGEVLTQIPAKERAIGLQRRGYQKITPASFNVTLFDETQPTAEPAIAKRGVQSDRGFERSLRFLEAVFSAQEKSTQCVRGRVARRKLETFFECLLRLRRPTQVEPRLGNSCPGKTKVCVEVCRALRRLQSASEIRLRLPII